MSAAHVHEWRVTRYNPWAHETEQRCACGAARHLWDLEDAPIDGPPRWREGPHPFSIPAAPTRKDVEALMKRCQIGVGGRRALDDAHSIMAACYGTLGLLMLTVERLQGRLNAARVCAQPHMGRGDDCGALARSIGELHE